MKQTLNAKNVADLFDKMSDEYDQIVDPWFDHLYEELNEVVKSIAKIARVKGTRALDVGCGTGIQTLLLSEANFDVIGIDISKALVLVADQKARNSRERNQIDFCVAMAELIPFESEIFDLVNCCGSVLSFVDNYVVALSELCRVLKPGGMLIMELEQKWNFDAFWTLISSLFGDFLGYENSTREALKLFLAPPDEGLGIVWPFTFLDGRTENMRLRLFTLSEISSSLLLYGVRLQEVLGLHIFTNLIPSTILSDPAERRWLRTMRFLSKIDKLVRKSAPFNQFGASIVLIGTKV